jgi:Protein of unknown function (DUF3311)
MALPSSSMNMKRKLAYLAVPALYLLHQDWWNWGSRQLILGLPVGLAYHVGFCVMASVLMFCLVRYAWPAHLELEAHEMAERRDGAWH